jgi:phospholipid-binding lipoprotein MlaA
MRIRIAAALLACTCLVACAHPPPAGDPDAAAEYRENNDPLEPTNRVFFRVNNGLDSYVLRPVAVEYRRVAPQAVRTHLHDALSNIANPVQFANDVMQGKPRSAGDTFMRFVINSTVGVGGFFDVATGWGYPDHDTDFGLTLALWGLPAGPFLFLPVLGPTNPRDAVGFGASTALDPFTWVSFGGNATLGWTRFGAGAVDGRERVLDQTDAITKTSLDPYATVRSLYQQHREAAVKDSEHDRPATVPAWYQPAR